MKSLGAKVRRKVVSPLRCLTVSDMMSVGLAKVSSTQMPRSDYGLGIIIYFPPTSAV